MKTVSLFILSTIIMAAVAQASLPQMTIGKNTKEVLELQELNVDIRFEGALVETIYELEFFNHSKRMEEGEFTLQLPEGVTISTYALDIRGDMRAGVSVEKNQARHAYETIKRKMIDPGLVEREEGNIYRNRIFPIEAQKPKRVRIGYIQTLTNAKFELPLKHDKKLKKFILTVRNVPKANVNLELEGEHESKSKKPREWSWDIADIESLDGALKVTADLPTADKPQVFTEINSKGDAHIVLQGVLPEDWKAKPLAKAKKIRLIWDRSLSGAQRDHNAEFKALRKYWEWLGDAKVDLQLLGLDLEKVGEFDLKDGGADKIEAALKAVTYDGAADFSKLTRQKTTTVLVTDGEISTPLWTPSPTGQWPGMIFLTSTPNNVAPELLTIASLHVNLRKDDWFDTLTKDQIGVSMSLKNGDWTARRIGRQILATGTLKGWEVIDAKIADKKIDIPHPGDATKSEWTFGRRIWAQETLLKLEERGVVDEIMDFSIQERLASDHTSLIVLERFEDYVRYKIPPPEPEIRRRYFTEIEKQKGNRVATVKDRWEAKLAWHATDYPWLDWQLAEEVHTVGIWVDSTRKVFEGNKLNQKALKPYEDWLPKAQEVVDAKEWLKTQDQFDDWRVNVGTSIEELSNIRANPNKPNPNDPIHVSVRGYVRYRGVYSGDGKRFTLRKAVEDAGGPDRLWGSWARVYLYRNATRIGYNLESAQYRDVPLRWGDMIVVDWDEDRRYGRGYYSDGFGGAPADPFADLDSGGGGGGGAPGLEMRQAPAVFEGPGSGGDTFDPAAGGDDPFNSNTNPAVEFDRELKIELVARPPQQLLTGANEDFLATLKENDDPEAQYEEMIAAGRFSLATLLESARIFFDKGEKELALRVMSNILEISPNKVEATRAYAYWLAELDSAQEGARLLNRLANKIEDARSRALVQFDAGQLSNTAVHFRNAAESELDVQPPTNLSTIALTDYFRRSDLEEGEEPGGQLQPFKANSMRSDIRIVLTSIGDAVNLHVDEPDARIAPDSAGLGFDDVAFAEDLGFGDLAAPDGVTGRHGGRQVNNDRVHEYQMRYGLPGHYRLLARRIDNDKDPITLRVTYYTHWGTENEKSISELILLDGKDVELGGIKFGWTD